MTKRVGALEKERSPEEEMVFAEESAMAQSAIVVANALEAAGMSQRALAARLGCTESWVSQLLSADSNPTVRTMARIGSAVGCRLNVQYVPLTLPSENLEPYPGRTQSGQWAISDDVVDQVTEAANNTSGEPLAA